jgi:leader peptidase (prepilin peptidase)/N-methyltransferase
LARTVPILSYIQQRGVCTVCRAGIDPTHLIGEIAGGAVLLSAIAASPTPRAAPLAALGFLLLATGVYDSKTQKLPDLLTVLIAVLGLVLAGSRSLEALVVGLVSAVLAFVVIEGVRRLFLKLRRKPGLGFGDVKLIAALAIWTGVATPWVVVIAALIGLAALLIRPPTDGKLAFGPCIAVAAWLVGVGGEAHLWPVLA